MTTQAYARRTPRKFHTPEVQTMQADDSSQADDRITAAELAELRQLSPKNLRRILGVLRAMRNGSWGETQQDVFEAYMTRGNRDGMLAMADHFAVQGGKTTAALPAYTPKVRLTGEDRVKGMRLAPLKKRCDSVAWAMLELFCARYWEMKSYVSETTGERFPMYDSPVWRKVEPDPKDDLLMAMFDVVSWLLAVDDPEKRDFMLREWVGEKYLAEWEAEGSEQP